MTHCCYLPTNPDHESQLGLSWNVVVTLISCLASHSDFIPFLITVLLHILLRPLENLDTLVSLKTALLKTNSVTHLISCNKLEISKTIL